MTGVAGLLSVVVWMFQSTHPRRVWRHLPQLIPVIRVFQSTHPRRVWHRQKFGKSGTGVSIHTPTQGVTIGLPVLPRYSGFQSTHPRRVWLRYGGTLYEVIQFQSTHPRRVWLNKKIGIPCFWEFQSTHPRRVWPIREDTGVAGYSFNPHTHAGCDKKDWT